MTSRHHRRHPCEVTSDRLADHVEQYYDKFTGAERDALSLVRHVLEQIADDKADDR